MRQFILIFLVFITTTSVAQRRFENKTFGFAMQEPMGWIWGNEDDLVRNLEKLDIDEEKLLKIIKEHEGSVLILSLYKYDPQTHKGLVPAIQINVRERNNEDYNAFKSHIIKSARSFEGLYDDFEFIEEPTDVKISHIKSIYFVTKFTMRTENGLTHRVRSRIYVIPWKHYYFQINMTDDLMGEDCSMEFLRLIKTIQIKRK
ncbi:hypothetical protein E0W68_05700 [Flavobacterium salilacus subsp. salilacus]|uniref:hypothetical protein n=1 Tax=Flavobacterium TaxID=237 RepID=UPI001074DE76|nr:MULTISPECIES: hypothetical protein [Flavobacterium]KAF2519261.1 hypothetical protein E0W68_05700 [Flavobacterium salilacus subsp. salilacus]MBE1613445.1 hypothetical protein [Flavobacterium sp. SaA2.13]